MTRPCRVGLRGAVPSATRTPVVKFEECGHRCAEDSAATPSEISELARCCAVFVPADPARTGTVAFWRPDGDPPPAVAAGTVDELTVVLPGEHGVERTRVTAVLLPVRAALPVLTRARAAAQAHRATAFWGTAAVLALQLAARGLLLPGLSARDHDAWRAGPLGAQDVERVRELAAAMPPDAHAVPSEGTEPPRLPDPERLLRAFLDAVADALPRSPAASLATGGAAYAVREPQHVPEQRAWAAEVAAGHDAGVRISLRIEVPGLASGEPDETALRFRAVLQVHSVSEPGLVADAAEVWAGTGGSAFGPRARMDALLALRRAARTWPPLTPCSRRPCRTPSNWPPKRSPSCSGRAPARCPPPGSRCTGPRSWPAS